MSQHIPLEDLSALLDDALPEARADQLRAHLADCARCRVEQAGLSWTRDFLRAGSPPPLPPGVELRLAMPDAPVTGADITILPFPGRGAWWGLGAVAALLLAAFMLRPLARSLGLGGASPEGDDAPSGAITLDQAAAPAPPGPAQLGANVDAMVGAAGTQAVADARGPTALALMATARSEDQARIVDGPSPAAGSPAAKAARGSEAGGYIPPEAGISGLGRPDVTMLQQLALAQPRATASALANLRATLAPRLTAPPPDADAAADLATLAAADVESTQLLSLLDSAGAPTAVPTAVAGGAVTRPAPRPTTAAATPTAGSTPAPAPAAPASGAGRAAADRAWVPALALMVALIALGLLTTVRARARRRRH